MIVAGFGFSTRATTASLRDALAKACAKADISTLDGLATTHDKAEFLLPLSLAMDLPIHPIDKESLTHQLVSTQSSRALQERGVGSVCEAAALAAAGSRARLLIVRTHASDRLASCAIAKGAHT